MASEAKRGLIRIAANFVRLGVTFVLGLLLVRMLLLAIGREGLGLVALMGSSMGIAGMLSEIVQNTSIRELGVAYHDKDDVRFAKTYSTSLLVAFAAAVISLCLFGILIWLVPVIFQIPDDLVTAARWFLFIQAIRTFFTLTLSPAFNMYQITERMITCSFWLVLDRVSYIVAAAVVLLMPSLTAAQAVVLYGAVCVGLYLLQLFLAVGIMVFYIDRRLLPRWSMISRETSGDLLSVGGWNFASRLAADLHLRVDNYLMNLWHGVAIGNVIFGALAVPLTAYARMISVGVTWGITSVATRLSAAHGTNAVRMLSYHTSRLQSLAVFPACAVLMVLPQAILHVWIGDRLDDPTGHLLHITAVLVRILALGMTFRAYSEGLINILYGAGHIAKYAPYMLYGGIANPIIAITLLIVLPQPLKYIGPSVSFTLLMLIVHVIVLPIIGSKLLQTPLPQMYWPAVRPFIITLASSPLLIAPLVTFETWNLLRLVGVGLAFGGVYAVLAYCFVITAEERSRFGGGIWRRIRPRREAGEEVGV